MSCSHMSTQSDKYTSTRTVSVISQLATVPVATVLYGTVPYQFFEYAYCTAVRVQYSTVPVLVQYVYRRGVQRGVSPLAE